MNTLAPTHDVDAMRAQVGQRQRDLSVQAATHRLARTASGDRSTRPALAGVLIRAYLQLWWVFRPRGAQLRHLLWSESTAPVMPRQGASS